MKTLPTVAAVACAAAFAFPAQAADSAAKIQKDQAETSYEMAKKQAADEEKTAMAQCGALSGERQEPVQKERRGGARQGDGRFQGQSGQGQGRLQGDQVAAGRARETAPCSAVLQ